MDSPRITQQTSTALGRHGEMTRDAPSPKALRTGDFSGVLQWALEGRGWDIVRPAFDLLLLVVALVIAIGGVGAIFHVSGSSAPLLALPPLVMLMFYLRGLYRTRLRALVLDGIVPVLSGVSVGAMTVAALGLLFNGQIPSQDRWVRARHSCSAHPDSNSPRLNRTKDRPRHQRSKSGPFTACRSCIGKRSRERGWSRTPDAMQRRSFSRSSRWWPRGSSMWDTGSWPTRRAA